MSQDRQPVETISVRSRSGLYSNLLGESWQSLSDTVRRLHPATAQVHATGVFRVRHGSSWFVRTLAGLAQLPAAGEAVDTQLLISVRSDSEEWRRTFAGRRLVSLQSRRPNGLLAERIGLVEVCFRLEVNRGALTYESTGAALSFGPLRVPLPRRFTPRILAQERPVSGGEELAVSVEVHLPLFGRLIAYDGRLTHIEAQGQ